MVQKNSYISPVDLKNGIKISYKESPAHTGRLKYSIDFMVPEGTPVFAVRTGVVFDVKDGSDIGGSDKSFDRFGNYIELEHDNGEYSFYEHIRKNGSIVKIGDRINKGELIGYSGATGWLAHLGPHLHFNIHTYRTEVSDEYESIPIAWDEETERIISALLIDN